MLTTLGKIAMKHETVAQLKTGAAAVTGTWLTWELQDYSTLISICVGLVTFLLVVMQIAFLLRKWHKLEQRNWRNDED